MSTTANMPLVVRFASGLLLFLVFLFLLIFCNILLIFFIWSTFGPSGIILVSCVVCPQFGFLCALWFILRKSATTASNQSLHKATQLVRLFSSRIIQVVGK